MLIPSAFRKLPNEKGCYNGQVVMGSNVAQMASALAQLSHCKFLGEAHYQISHSTYSTDWGAEQYGARLHTATRVLKGYSGQDYHFLYQSTALSERLAIILVYGADYLASSPSITIELRDTASNSYSGTVLDYGIRFTAPQHLESVNVPFGDAMPPDSWAFSGTRKISAPSNTTPEGPRPLYVPSANRGDLLNIKVTVSSVSLTAVHIYDLYELEVTP